ncbi:MAG: hypothetical protein AAGU27_24320, partial [Dehalobacterium sp.]
SSNKYFYQVVLLETAKEKKSDKVVIRLPSLLEMITPVDYHAGKAHETQTKRKGRNFRIPDVKLVFITRVLVY